MTNWPKKKFESVYEIPSRNGLSKPSKVRGTGYKMINMGELFSNNRIYDIDMELVPLTDSEKEKAKVEPGDLLFARQSLVAEGAGKCIIVMETSELTVFESHIIRVRLNKKQADPLFYYYYFRSSASPMKTIVQHCVQAGIKASDLSKLEVIVPPLSEQQKIASIFNSIDTKIENNNRINQNLLEQAQALYREMFVNTQNESRKECRAEEYFDIAIGKTPPRKEHQWFTSNPDDVTWISISDMGSCGTYISRSFEQLTKEAVEKFNIRVIPDNTVLLSFKLTVGRIAITHGEMTTNEAIAHFKTDKPYINEYLYCYLKDFNYQTMGSTSSIATAVNSKIIKAMPFIVPAEDEIARFHAVAGPIFAQILNNQLENDTLASLRDSLLPKLMSGELDVSEIEL